MPFRRISEIQLYQRQSIVVPCSGRPSNRDLELIKSRLYSHLLEDPGKAIPIPSATSSDDNIIIIYPTEHQRQYSCQCKIAT